MSKSTFIPMHLRSCKPVVDVYVTYGDPEKTINEFRAAVRALESFLLFYGIRMNMSASTYGERFMFVDLRTGKPFGEDGLFAGLETLPRVRPELFE